MKQAKEESDKQLAEARSALAQASAEVRVLKEETESEKAEKAELQSQLTQLQEELEEAKKAGASASSNQQGDQWFHNQLAARANEFVAVPLGAVAPSAQHTGWLSVYTGGWKKRYFVLKDNYLFYFKSDKVCFFFRSVFSFFFVELVLARVVVARGPARHRTVRLVGLAVSSVSILTGFGGMICSITGLNLPTLIPLSSNSFATPTINGFNL